MPEFKFARLIEVERLEVVPYLCCVHCVHWDGIWLNPNNHATPCNHVSSLGRKDCIAGQIPSDVD